MSDVNFIQVIEELDEYVLGVVESETVKVSVGKQSKKFYGIKIVGGTKIRTIWFSDIERMKQIIDKMGGQNVRQKAS
jgi:hypothetical protein